MRQLLDKVVDVPVFVVVSDTVEVPQLQFVGAVQFFDKVADVPVAAAHSSLLGMIVVCQCHRSRRFSCWVSLFFGELIVVCQCHRSWRTSSR